MKLWQQQIGNKCHKETAIIIFVIESEDKFIIGIGCASIKGNQNFSDPLVYL